jgi:RHS repeat-associated protein
MTGATGLLDHIEYDPFGKPASQTASTYSGSVMFAGMRYDPLTGQADTRWRQVSPSMMRWLSPDPIMADINTYRYAGNNPTNATDPSGMVERWYGPRLPENRNWSQMWAKKADGSWAHIGIYDWASDTVRNGNRQVPFAQIKEALDGKDVPDMQAWWYKNGDYITPIWERVPPQNSSIAQTWDAIQPNYKENRQQAAAIAQMGAVVVVFWNAAGAYEFVSVSGSRFVWSSAARKWTNVKNGAEATAKEAAAANAAIGRGQIIKMSPQGAQVANGAKRIAELDAKMEEIARRYRAGQMTAEEAQRLMAEITAELGQFGH